MMPDGVKNLVRELEKIRDAVRAADLHFRAKDEMNAALHLAATVRSTPLAAEIAVARDSLDRLIAMLQSEES